MTTMVVICEHEVDFLVRVLVEALSEEGHLRMDELRFASRLLVRALAASGAPDAARAAAELRVAKLQERSRIGGTVPNDACGCSNHESK